MRKFLIMMVVVGVILIGLGVCVSYAGEVDILLQKLVEKNILTQEEGKQVVKETKGQVKKELAESKSEGVPQWIQDTKLKGDFRLRYEWDKNKGQVDQSRVRIRTRLGLESKINNKLKMGVGIATGKAGDPRSRNNTLGSDNSTTSNTPGSPKNIILDYGYAQYTPLSWLTVIGGKFQNNLWQPHDVFWKGDITPEGAAANLSYKFDEKITLFFNEMLFFLKNDTRTDQNQAFMNAVQPGVNISLRDNLSLKTAVACYLFEHVQDEAKFSYSKSGDSTYPKSGNTLANGNYKYNYNSFQPSAELSIKEPFSGLVHFASVFVDYMYNSAPANGKGGFDAGIKFGVEKVSDYGQWQGKLVYSKLGRDCWLDIFTDSDRYGGDTNSKAFEGIFEYGLGKNTNLVLDYYFAESLTKNDVANYNSEQVVQIDWNIKF